MPPPVVPPAVVLGPPHQLGQLSDVAGHALSDLLAGGPVDEDEEGRAGHLVVEPCLGRHHHGNPAAVPGPDFGHDLPVGTLGDDHDAGVVGQAEVLGFLKGVPEGAAGGASRREEAEEGEVVAVVHRHGARVARGRHAGHRRRRTERGAR